MVFDNHDSRIKYYELVLECADLDEIPEYKLPDGYKFVFYQNGDRDAWIEIEKSAREFQSYAEGLEAWNRYYGGREEELFNRMVFVENENGEKLATATAFYDVFGKDRSGAAMLHWVAVKREYQGLGISKPLISHAIGIMRSLGYTHAKIPTQTTTWLACKIYLDFGFVPVPQNAVNSRDGWRIIKALTGHAVLSDFDCADITEIIEKNAPKS